jgi:hypothetical protein
LNFSLSTPPDPSSFHHDQAKEVTTAHANYDSSREPAEFKGFFLEEV